MPFNMSGGPLRYTDNYVYSIKDCLGRGATASVYLGRERKNGKQVAIKVFSDDESRHITQAKFRETELLKIINHGNVMRLLAYERETESRQCVIVMPYCQCGSVHNLLEQPQNGFGFQEKEFLIFLKDITSGLKHLKEREIIHRDIKPGNIMKHVNEDDSPVYILTDFGAARQLGDEETFMSIYGTEEYIHPDMFQRAVLRQPGQSQFTSAVDLWSLAVTIYHVATGKLPFQAFGGRQDSRMMFQIMSGRRSGDISGIQREPGGSIDRSKHLPESCHLSGGLKRLIEPILVGLFHIDQSRAWTFDQYFNAVNDVIEMKTLKVFIAQTATQIVLYLHKTDCYRHIQEKIVSLTEIPAECQLILLAHTDLKDIVETHQQIQHFPKSVQNAQLFLFEKDNFGLKPLSVSNLPPFPSFSVNSSLSNDSSLAKKCAAIACFIEWKTRETNTLWKNLLDSKLHFRLFVQQKLVPIEEVVPQLDREIGITKEWTDRIHMLQEMMDITFAPLKELRQDRDSIKQLGNVVKSFISGDSCRVESTTETNTRFEEIKTYMSVLGQRIREGSTPSPTDHMGCHEEDHCLSRVEHIRQGIQTVSSTFSEHKKCGDLQPHDKFIHTAEREKLEDLCVKILSLYQGHCLDNLKRVHHAVIKELRVLQKHLTRAGKVETNIKCVAECQVKINEKLDKLDERYYTVSEIMRTNIKDIFGNPSVVTKMARREPTEFSETSHAATSDEGEKLAKRRRLMSEIWQEESHLSLTSFQNDKNSVDCTELLDSNGACEFS